MQSRGICHPSVRPSVCKHFANRFFSQANGWIATKLAYHGPHRACIWGVLKVKVKVKGHVIGTFVISRKSLLLAGKWLDRHQTCTRWFPARPASRVCSRSRSRSKVTWYGHFCDFTKIASSRRWMAGSPPNLYTMVSRLVYAEDVLNLKVNVKLYTIWALIWFHKNCFFSQANGCILTKLSLSLTSPTLCPFGFLPHSNPQMAVSLRCEFRHSSQGETVCQTVCYTLRSHVLSLHALTLWSTVTLSFQYKYQAARSNV